MEDLLLKAMGSKVIALVTRNRVDTKRMNPGVVEAVGLIAAIAAAALLVAVVKILTDL